MPDHKVIIIGGGFGGLYAARALKSAPVEVTLLDRRNFHLFQPLLYQVATGTLTPGLIAAPLRLILKRQANTRVYLAEAEDFDVSGRNVLLRDGSRMPYDSLILAAGSEPNYFGHAEWPHLAPGLKTVEDATHMRSRILLAFEKAERETNPDQIKRWMTFVIVGAGPTGVELAGALAEIARKTLRDGFHHIETAEARIVLVDAVKQVLPGYPPGLAAKAERTLKGLHVTTRFNCRVTEVFSDSVTLQREDGTTERIETRTILWTAGVRASPLGERLAKSAGASVDKEGRVIVEPNLSVPGHPELFIIGDLANPSARDKQTLPGVAPVAIQEGRYVAEVIRRRLKGEPAPRAFHYHDPGSMATIGRNAAVAHIGRLQVNGFTAWLIWLFVHLYQLIGFQNRLLVMLQWAWNYLTWKRADLLITAAPSKKSQV